MALSEAVVEVVGMKVVRTVRMRLTVAVKVSKLANTVIMVVMMVVTVAVAVKEALSDSGGGGGVGGGRKSSRINGCGTVVTEVAVP